MIRKCNSNNLGQYSFSSNLTSNLKNLNLTQLVRIPLISFQQLLNCCFDDIEKFVARLQQAAEAYRELDRRRSRRQGRNRRAVGGESSFPFTSPNNGYNIIRQNVWVNSSAECSPFIVKLCLKIKTL